MEMTYEEVIKEIDYDGYCESVCSKCEVKYRCRKWKAKEIAIECIEKQTPKKPINATGYYRDNKCPTCGKPLKSGQGSSSHYRNNWCNKCGQAIDWSEVE